ncbi:PQQ-binding-like beta-propeller repeat protein [Litoribrevibacter albus]|uniref:Pyrrolo-quinoline quinone repeat domain-containing protein n=1 Tax=Litoribrevibacter albus TaxID=1473156 RepID=A0AA37S7H1_9GAMM|nr:PQQ-binding-like beta-propeller repeat protein [Litoribrevibacter albus]GLQ29964.1 hypothetical protein GCM10007876_04420 [Litoribrevibacter albus]
MFQPVKLTLLAAAVASLTACGSSSDSKSSHSESTVYGDLHGLQASVSVDASENRIMVAGQTTAIIQAMDPSTVLPAGGVDPALYILPNQSPATAADSQWRPDALPDVNAAGAPLEAQGFYALHGDTRNSDEVLSAAAPETQLSWIAEKHFFSYEGGVFDRNSNVYVVPVDPVEDVYLSSIDGETGERRWSLPGKRIGQGGAPLILPANDGSDEDIIYIGSYEYMTAVTSSGKVLWDVKTGLKAPADATQISTHNYGINYHPQTNSMIAVYADGHISVHDRDTGLVKISPYSLPGAATLNTQFETDYSKLEPFVHNGLSKLMEDTQTFFDVLTMVLGGGYEVSNYFGIDPSSGRILIGATAPDEADGEEDGFSALGALYALDFNEDGNLEIQWRRDFEGGTAATPTLSYDGSVVYTADSVDKMLAIDAETGDLIWEYQTGSGQVVGSIAISREDNEIFLSTAIDIIKVKDMGNCAGNGTDCDTPVWTAKLDDAFNTSVLSEATTQAHMYQNVLKPAIEGFYQSVGTQGFEFMPMAGNMVLAGITGNGVVAQAGYGYLSPQGKVMPFQISQVILDRETGDIRYSAPGIEESVSVMATAPNGDLYMSNSPLRRILNVAMIRAVGFKTNNTSLQYFGNEALGGISQFTQKPGSKIRVAQEAGQAAIHRIDNLIAKAGTASEAARSAEVDRLYGLIGQMIESVNAAASLSEITESDAATMLTALEDAKALGLADLPTMKAKLEEWQALL